MKLIKAIAILANLPGQTYCFTGPDDQDAIKLAIEALKFAKSSRDPSGVPPYPLLPGEDPA